MASYKIVLSLGAALLVSLPSVAASPILMQGHGKALFDGAIECPVTFDLSVVEAPNAHYAILSLRAECDFAGYYVALPLYLTFGSVYRLQGNWEEGFSGGNADFSIRIRTAEQGTLLVEGCMSCTIGAPFRWSGTAVSVL